MAGKMKQTAFKAEIVKARDVPNLKFSTSLLRSGFWNEKITALYADPDSLLKLLAEDGYSLNQIRQAAKKANVELRFAREDKFVYVRAFVASADQASLYLLLREPRTVDALRGRNLQLDVEGELSRLAAAGRAAKDHAKNTWKLTSKGIADLIPEAA